jgi:hypothetical protein
MTIEEIRAHLQENADALAEISRRGWTFVQIHHEGCDWFEIGPQRGKFSVEMRGIGRTLAEAVANAQESKP